MMRRAFSAFRPHIVFHAAELKQIHLAQTNPREAFLTNVFGLKTVCDLADEYAAEKFILCSTIRASSPASVYAECKRTAELYIEEKNSKSQTIYASVRFSNLIEGRGNVISIFEKQISQGGPLTITDKDIVRRFISAEEAALLTVRAAAQTEGGEIFELGPGEAIGIRELAEAMIRLAGKIPYEEIDIITTQLRPGELLFEDSDIEGQRGEETEADRIWLTKDNSGAKLPHWSQLWCEEQDRMDDVYVMDLLKLIFPTYKTKSGVKTTRGEKIEDE
jgi:FlaA1/EpsC-like NDP-sugar epimerase